MKKNKKIIPIEISKNVDRLPEKRFVGLITSLQQFKNGIYLEFNIYRKRIIV